MEEHLADEERIALRLKMNRGSEHLPLGLELVTSRALQERHHPCGVEATQRDAFRTALPSQVRQHLSERMRPVEVGVAVRPDEHQARLRGRTEHVPQEQQRRLAGPVQVV